MAKIQIHKNQQYVIASDMEKEDFFLDIYKQAFDQLGHMITALNEAKESKNFSFQMPNNILAFDGQRGQGKTSAMLTFAGFLKNNKAENEQIKNYRFEVLDPIDPSSFESHHTVLQVLVAQLYRRFEDIYKMQNDFNVPPNIDDDMNQLVIFFQKVYESLALIRDESKAREILGQYEGSLEQISRAGDSTSLASHLYQLINLFLRFCSPVASNKLNDFLVIPIDDIDLSMDYAYHLAEEIRKYLAVPNVIVVMAVKLDQLKEGIRAHFWKKLRDWPSETSQDESVQMADKYLTKLIPISHRISLPSISDQAAQDFDNTVFSFADCNGSNKEIVVENGIQSVLLELIWKKTGLIFLRDYDTANPIVPGTLREMVQLLTLLQYDMESLSNPAQAYLANAKEEDYKKQRHNLNLFMTYFTSVWAANMLAPAQSVIVKEAWQANIADRKILICNHLLHFIESSSEDTPMPRSRKDISAIYDRALQIISGQESTMGAVNTLLNAVAYIFPGAHIHNMVFALRTVLSASMLILLLETMFDPSTPERQSKLYDFVGGEFWGEQVQYEKQSSSYRLTPRKTRMIRSEVGGHSRVSFSTSLPDMLRNGDIEPAFDSTILGSHNILSTSKLTKEHCEKLAYYALIGHPANANSMVAGNNTMVRDYVVDLETFLCSALYPSSIESRIGLTLTALPEHKGIRDVMERIEMQLSIPIIKTVIVNVDLALALATHLEQTRNLRIKIDGFSDYIMDFFQRFSSFFTIDKALIPAKAKMISYELWHEYRPLFEDHFEKNPLNELISQCMAVANKYRSNNEVPGTIPFNMSVPNANTAGRTESTNTWKQLWRKMRQASLKEYDENTCQQIKAFLDEGEAIIEECKEEKVDQAQRDKLKGITNSLRMIVAEVQ